MHGQNYCTIILRILHFSATVLAMLKNHRELGTTESPEYDHDVPLHLNRFLSFWERIMNAKNAILNSDNLPELHMILLETFGASISLCRVRPYVQYLFASSKRTIDLTAFLSSVPGFLRELEKSSAFPIVVQIWVKNTNDFAIRYRAVKVFDEALVLANRESIGANGRLFSANPNMCKQVIQAGLRDLRLSSCSTSHLLLLLLYMPGARLVARGVKLSNAIDYKVFRASAAAFRTVLCSSHKTTGQTQFPTASWYRCELVDRVGNVHRPC